MQTFPEKVAEVGKLLRDAADHNQKSDLTEMLLTVRDGLNRDFQESFRAIN